MQKGEVLIAMRFANSLEWPDSLRRYERNGVKYDISISAGQRNAAVVLTASLDEYGSLVNFIQAVEERVVVDFSRVQESGAAVVTDLHGNTLLIEHDGARQVNGTDLDYTQWPAVESVDRIEGEEPVQLPLLSQPAGSFLLQVTVPGHPPCVYNFKDWTTTCRP